MEENKSNNNSSNNRNNKSINIGMMIKDLLLNYDLTIAYIQAEIDLRENQIKMIDLIVAASEKKEPNKRQKKRQILLRADIEIFENSLNELLSRRIRLLNSISMILERLKNADIVKQVFIDYYLKEEKTKEEIMEENQIKSTEEFESILEIINKQLINIYRY